MAEIQLMFFFVGFGCQIMEPKCVVMKCVLLSQVYASGYGAYGRLGIGGIENMAAPTLIPSLASRGVIIKKLAVHSGGKHCLAVTTHGELYSWGEGEDGKLGIGATG